MRIKTSDIIAGQPAIAIRKLLQHDRAHSSAFGSTLATIAEILGVAASVAQQIFQELCAEGYITPITTTDPFFHDDIIYWHNTTKGNSLAAASARKPIKRKTAEQHIQKFLERVKDINDCNDYAYFIKQVIVFGSYLSDSPDLGDVDLAIAIEPRHSNQERQKDLEDKRRNNALQEGRNFQNFLEELAWPQYEIFRILKARSPSISIHDLRYEQILKEPIPSKILFDFTQVNQNR